MIGAAALSLFGAFFHGVPGARIYLGNINASTLEPLGKSLSVVSWHIFTIFLTVSGATFLAVAFDLASASAAWPLIAANALGAMLFLGLSFRGPCFAFPESTSWASRRFAALLLFPDG